MSIHRELKEARLRLRTAQNKITRFAILGVEVGEDKELDDAINESRLYRRELDNLMRAGATLNEI